MSKRDLRPWRRAVLLAAALLGATALSSHPVTVGATSADSSPGAFRAANPQPFADGARAACCFTNPAYAGVCRVEPNEGETCASILDYLNTGQTSGKSYCDSTLIRGGWDSVSCSDEKAPEEGADR